MGHNLTYTELIDRVAELEREVTRLRSQARSSSVHDAASSRESAPFDKVPPRPEIINSMLQMVIDSMPQYIFWKDKHSRYLGCNKKFALATGLRSPNEIVGCTDFDLPWTTEEAEQYRDSDSRIMASDRPEYNILKTQRTLSGKVISISVSKIPLHNRKRQVIGILGSYEDVTDRLQNEQMLKNYETITANVDDLLAIVDNNHIYIAVNEAHFGAYGVRKETILGQSIEDLIGGEIYRDLVRDKINLALRGETVVFETWRNFPHWGRRYVQISYFPLIGDDKKVTGVVSKIRDMTQNKKLETQLQQAQKMEAIGRLAGGIAHDFNNILSVINGYSDFCLLKMEDDNSCIGHIQMIKDSGLRAARLTEQLLAFSRKQIIQPERLNLAGELEYISHMLRRLLGENIEIDLIKNTTCWDVKLDRSQLEQIVMNLTVNARDAMPHGGKLTIEIRNHHCDADSINGLCGITPGEYVMLLVTDNGTGMDNETTSNIFEPFFTTKEESKGTGLGLSTVYGIVKQNNGYISVHSELHQGTTFTLFFPRCTGPITATSRYTPATETTTVLTGTANILLVEDDSALRQMCGEILSELGYTVMKAANGKDALDSALKFDGKIDLLLTDVVMPSQSGPEVARALTEYDPSIRVLYMSGYTEKAIVHHGVLKEGINFIHKPISRVSLALAVRKALWPASTDRPHPLTRLLRQIHQYHNQVKQKPTQAVLI